MNQFLIPAVDKIETGRNIKRLINQSGYTVTKVMKILGIESPRAVYKWFNGESVPTVDNLVALSSILNVPIDDIICTKEVSRWRSKPQ